MLTKGLLVLFALFLAALLPLSHAGAFVGTATIRAPAVIVTNNTGELTTFVVDVYSGGNGTVRILGPSSIGNSTNQSAETAARYAAKYLHLNFSKYNFNYSILDTSGSVDGPSGGAAMTILAVSALSGRQLLTNFTMTGTISPNGTIGPIGGAYDKTSAAKANGMKFILVPAVGGGSTDEELYFLAQDLFGIPVVQVANISQAAQFAFGQKNPALYETNYSFGQPLNLRALPNAPFSCSNGCNTNVFKGVINTTIARAQAQLAMIKQPPFGNVAARLAPLLNQTPVLAQKGYLYPAGDFAFLNYLNSFYFNNYETSTALGMQKLNSINSFCNSIAIPNLTSTNYEYVITGEVRQAWAEETLNASLTDYNSTIQTSDDVLYAMKLGASADAWCTTTQLLYNAGTSLGGTDTVAAGNLSSVAAARISRASRYGGSLYLTAAQEALLVKNYPLAIIQADYSYAINNATASSDSTGLLLNESAALTRNATFGVWATQFSNEAFMYATEARASTNSSTALSYAQQAYTSALLASQFNNDMQVISANLAPGSAPQQIMPNVTNSTSQLTVLVQTNQTAFVLALAALGFFIIMFAVVLYFLLRLVSQPPAPPQPPVPPVAPKVKAKPVRKRRKRKA